MRGDLNRLLSLWSGCCRSVEVAHAERPQCAAPVLQLYELPPVGERIRVVLHAGPAHSAPGWCRSLRVDA